MQNSRGPGRANAADIARRRLEAGKYLEEHFPRSANLWTELRSNQLTPEKLVETVNAMIAEANSVKAPELPRSRDKMTLNPEQAVACVLKRIGDREEKIAGCRAELLALDCVRGAIEQLLAAYQDAARDDVAAIAAAAAQRPTVDREVERRTLDLLRTGVSRANLIRLKQNADKLWKRPHDWATVPNTVGRFTLSDRPPSSGIERELLPPSSNILHYCRDAKDFQQQAVAATPDRAMALAVSELADWITLHYPGGRVRQPAMMAEAWATLILLEDPAVQANKRNIDVLMPSPWKPGRVVRIKSED